MPTNDPKWYREYYLKNRDRIRLVRRLYYLRNRERLLAYQKEYNKRRSAEDRAAGVISPYNPPRKRTNGERPGLRSDNAPV